MGRVGFMRREEEMGERERFENQPSLIGQMEVIDIIHVKTSILE